METLFLIISDHFSQFSGITTSAKDKLQQEKNKKIRDYSRFSADRFDDDLSADDLSEDDWNRLIANGSNYVNKLFSSFCNKYNTILKKHAPVKNM